MQPDEAVQKQADIEARYAALIRAATTEAERVRLDAQRSREIAAIQRDLSRQQVERAHEWMS